jgi:hypothetical protein
MRARCGEPPEPFVVDLRPRAHARRDVNAATNGAGRVAEHEGLSEEARAEEHPGQRARVQPREVCFMCLEKVAFHQARCALDDKEIISSVVRSFERILPGDFFLSYRAGLTARLRCLLKLRNRRANMGRRTVDGQELLHGAAR